jgi:hypothetical protein
MSHKLIASDRVQGTSVCRSTGEEIGVIRRVMIDKISGEVAYAVMAFGGFFGSAQKHLPIPWKLLRYSQKLGAYEVELPEGELRKASSRSQEEGFDWGDRPVDVATRYARHSVWE